MAIIAHGSAGAWSETTTTTDNIGVRGSETADTRVFLLAAWKDFSITATVADAGGSYTELTEFADGSVAAGNGTGSMKVGAWYKDNIGGNSPTITYSSAPTVANCALLEFDKSSSETWNTPLIATAAWGLGGSAGQTVSASSSVAVPNGGVVMAIIGIRDDSATFTRGATTGIDVSSGITWAADYVEDPVTHKSSTTGNDMAADLGYRFVTTGSTVTLRVTATLSADETGSVLWIVQGLQAAATTSLIFRRHPNRGLIVR